MCFLLAYGGRLSIDFVEEVLGGSGGVIATIASTILLGVVVFLLYKVDWEKYFPFEEKHGNKTQ